MIGAIHRMLVPQTIAQTRRFAARPQDEQAVDAAGKNVLDQAFQTGLIERVTIQQRRD